MDKERNLKKPYNFFKDSDKSAQRSRKNESPYSISPKRIKISHTNSPDKQCDLKRTSLEVTEITEDTNDDIPDRSFGDFYCKACNSHMSSEQIWESHIQGKRHLKNTKKKGADLEYEFVDQDPIMLPEIKKVQKPIIGLQHCCEIVCSYRKPVYQCFLCSASIPSSKVLIEHVIGLKHRMAYLKIHDTINYNIITKAELKKGMIEPLVEEFIQKYQDKHGLGKMRVKVAKKNFASSSNNSSRPHNDDLIHNKNRNFGKNSYEDVRNESVSENTDWMHDRNSYDDIINEPISEKPDWRQIKNSYDEGKKETENPDWRHSRNSYDDERNESKPEDSNWRPISGNERDYHSGDKYVSEIQYEKSIRQNHFDKNEIAYSERLYSTPPLNPKATYEDNKIDMNTTWKMSNQISQHEDLRDLLEKKRLLESSKTVPNNKNAFEFVLSAIEDLPNMKFLELVLHKVQKMKDPSETELNMLSKIGKCMFSIVMEKKMDMLTPDLRKKYQSVTNNTLNQSSVLKTVIPEQKSKNKLDFQSLMDLIKNPKRESEQPMLNNSFLLQNVSSPLEVATTSNHQPAYKTESPNFMWGTTPSLQSTSSPKDFPSIPGLTLSGSQGISSDGQYSYSHEPYTSTHNAWSTIKHKNDLNRY